ncbi:putative protein conserved in bacteria [Candidatus Ornithobacterium hominis]|uniref:DUF2141 domain-containing protein n=1 Tax=Candidatus Ornithobacterium hominis TaxID=2497989 RepID=UPI0024BCD980|nr:DUF2141 domain-containing protein [Candidatus Ornithobacterium hominis]CAI9430136.1 putative protein conserved in bacteria [Candidatus Ornithobacterium hominis]
MKNFISLILTLFVIITQAQTAHLSVEIKNIKSKKGKVLIALFNSEKGFPHENEFMTVQLEPEENIIQHRFKNVPKGIYAVAVLHDENNNGKMDIGMLGPKEKYGFSNDARSLISAPTFKKASFKHSGNQKIIIHLK